MFIISMERLQSLKVTVRPKDLHPQGGGNFHCYDRLSKGNIEPWWVRLFSNSNDFLRQVSSNTSLFSVCDSPLSNNDHQGYPMLSCLFEYISNLKHGTNNH